GSVAEKPEIAPQSVGELLEQRVQMGRAGLLFPFEKELQVDRRAKTCRSKRVESGHPTHQRRLVVGSRSAVETPFRFHAPAGRERVPRDLAASFLERLVAKNRSPRI